MIRLLRIGNKLKDFDPSSHGLESHYNTQQQYKIRRMILEDWKQSNAKLPTYMNLLSLYIVPERVPDDWLKKLSHQTMSKMLNNISTPRYEFWACLHLFLNKKYGDIELNEINEVSHLGIALKGFGEQECEIEGDFILDENLALRLVIKDGYTHVAMIKCYQSNEPFSDKVYTNYEGAGIQQNKQLICLNRNLATKKINVLKSSIKGLLPLDKPELKERLCQVVYG